jgi:O-antigen/teichoic acid export membrane protein
LSFIKDIKFDSARLVSLSREFGWIGFGQFASLIGSIYLVRVLTTYLTPSEYGLLALSLTILTLINQVFFGGVSAAAARFYSIAVGRNDLFGLFRSINSFFRLIIGALIIFTLIAIIILYTKGDIYSIYLTILIILYAIILSVGAIINSIQNAARQRKIVAIHGAFQEWLKIGLAFVFLKFLGFKSHNVILGFLVSSFLVTFSQFIFLKRTITKSGFVNNCVNKNTWFSEIWAYSWPMLAGGVFNWAFYSSQRWSLDTLASRSAVGKFFALTQLTYTPIVLLGGLILTLVSPIIFNRIGDLTNAESLNAARNLIYKLSGVTLIGTLLISFLSMFIPNSLYFLFVSSSYIEVFKFTPLLILSAGILQSSHFLGLLVTISLKSNKIIPLAVIGQSIMIALNFGSVWLYGIKGLFLSMVLASIIHFIWMLRITKNIY